MNITPREARARLDVCGDSDALRQLCESILVSWKVDRDRLADAESEAASARENADELSCEVASLEDKLEAFAAIPSLVTKILGHEDVISESIDLFNLRRAVDDIRSL